jgi:phenylpyruvate tautomerase PptA (4-oxalocrotonate tautomerase family)
MDTVMAAAARVHVDEVLGALCAAVQARLPAAGIAPTLAAGPLPAVVFAVTDAMAVHLTLDPGTGHVVVTVVGTPPSAPLSRTLGCCLALVYVAVASWRRVMWSVQARWPPCPAAWAAEVSPPPPPPPPTRP